MAYDGKLQFNTLIDTAGFLSGINNIGSIAQKGIDLIAQKGIGSIVNFAQIGMHNIASLAEKSAEAIGKSIALTSKGMKELGEMALNLSKKAVDVGKSFESSMSQVIATMGVTKDSMVEITNADGTVSTVNAYDMLSDKAKEMGAATKYSASEAADALNYLALAGYDAQKSCEALPAVLDLASAGGMELADTSDLVTDAMSALGIDATYENLTHFSDVLAKTASSSNTSVSQLGEAMLVCGGQCRTAGVELEDASTLLGILADNGIKGSEGGTALRNLLKNMYTPTSQAAKALGNLGISIKDDLTGELKPAQDVLIDTMSALENLSEADRMQYMSDIFDTRTIAAASAALNNSSERYDELHEKIMNCDGACQQMSKTMSDNLEGDMKILDSSAEALGNTFYESIVGNLRKTVQESTEWIGMLNTAFETDGILGFADEIGNVVKLMLKKAYLELPNFLEIGRDFINTMCDGIKDKSSSIEIYGSGIIIDLVKGFSNSFTSFYNLGFFILSSLLEGLAISDNTQELKETMQNFITGIAKTLAVYIPQIAENGAEILTAMADGFSKSLPTLISSAGKIVKSLLKTIRSNLPELMKSGQQMIFSIFDGSLGYLIDEKASDIAIDIITSLVKFVLTEAPTLLDAGLELLESLLEGATDGLNEIIPFVTSFIEELCTIITEHLPDILEIGFDILMSLVNGIIDNLPTIIEAAVSILIALAEFIGDNIDTLLDAAILIITTICNELLTKDNLEKLVDSAIKIIEEIAKGISDNLPLLIECATNIISELMRYLNDKENQENILECAGKVVGSLVAGMIDSVDEVVDFVAMLLVELGRAIGNTDWAYLGQCINDGILSGLFGIEWNSDEFWDYFTDYYNIDSVNPNTKDYFVSNSNEVTEKEIAINADTTNFDKSLDEIYSQDRVIDFDIRSGFSYDVDTEEAEKRMSLLSDSYAFNFDSEAIAGKLENAVSANQTAITSAITSSCEPINNISSEVKTGFEEALKNAELDGDTYLSVNIGDERIDDIVISSMERQNARTGGRY